MRDLPVDLNGFKLMVSETPTLKMRKDKKTGDEVPATNWEGEPRYIVVLFAKPREAGRSGRRAKGEEIKVTLDVDPGEVDEGTFVQLVTPTVSHYEIEEDGVITRSGLSYAATALSPIGG